MSDATIRQDVIDELEFEPSLDAEHIGVAVEEGVVTLTGHVCSYAAKMAAENAASRVRGVRAIAEELEVRYPGDKRTDDGEIARRVLNVLRWSTVVPDGILVKVQKGWVTLTGAVNWKYQQGAAGNDVLHLSGVVGLTNNITIRPLVQAEDVKSKIEGALKRNAEIEAQGIRVMAVGDKVTLEGAVHDLQERRTVENAAWSVPGVKSVTDLLRIIPRL